MALCLQETYLQPVNQNVLRRFNVFRKDRLYAARPSGGVAIVTQKHVPCVEVSLNTSLEAVAVRLLTDRLITVCSLYIPPGYSLTVHELECLTEQLPTPFLIMGDFNAHNPLWGSCRRDTRGSVIERFVLLAGVCIMNSGQATHYSASSCTFTSIDLSIIHPGIFDNYLWKVLENPLVNDHFPLIVEPCMLPAVLNSRTPR